MKQAEQKYNSTDHSLGKWEKGSLDLLGYRLVTMDEEEGLFSKKKLLLCLVSSSEGEDKEDRRILKLSFDTEASREMWKDALSDHILYSNFVHNNMIGIIREE